MKKLKFEMIKAEDHFADNSDWVYPENYVPDKHYLEYTGWVIYEDDGVVVLAQGRTLEKDIQNDDIMKYDNLIHLMKPAIVKRKTLRIE